MGGVNVIMEGGGGAKKCCSTQGWVISGVVTVLVIVTIAIVVAVTTLGNSGEQLQPVTFLRQPSFSSGCSDDPRWVQDCPGWSRYCSSHAHFMHKNCPKTCKICTCSCQDHPRYRNSCS